MNAIQWTTTEVGKLYELRDGEVMGTLRFAPKPAITWQFADPRRATAEAKSDRWEFQIARSGVAGFFGLRATVYVSGSDTGDLPAGAFFSSGTLQLNNGRRFRWNGGTARNSPSQFLDENERVLITFQHGSIFENVNTNIEVHEDAQNLKECPLLLALGLYLRLAANKIYR